jgi:hypothetical protein
MSSDRRHFLQRFVAGAAALGASPSLLGASSTHDAERLDAPFDSSLLAEITALDAEQQQAAPWDTAWTSKITGKHRAVFDAPDLDGGSGVYRAAMWAGHYKSVLKLEDSDISPVVVIRHSAIPLAMTHEFWEEYDVAKQNKIMHPMTGKKTKRNPVLMNAEVDGLSPGFARLSLDKQIAAGTTVLACNLAFVSMVSLVSKKHGLKGEDARKKALAGLVPGVILQPSGIFAVQMAQENGCKYIRAS